MLAAVWTVQDVINILLVGLGLGLVIFIHELGHFAVAKWCGVKVERFSIGFGPVIWKYTLGDTEYALSAIPFGGYVKMLGQDDADPSQMTDERIAQDSRSYTSKSVPQRMAIISAGVFNNMVSAVAFFIVAFMLGVQYEPAVIGGVAPGMPAWEAGLRMGDRITAVNSRSDSQLRFIDVRQAVALSHGPVEINAVRDGKPFSVSVEPTTKDRLLPEIGVEPDVSTTLPDRRTLERGGRLVSKALSASRATPPFEAGDKIVRVDDVPIETFADLQLSLARKRDKTVTFHVVRQGAAAGETVAIRVEPNKFHTLGLRMEMGRIAAIQENSPAARSALKVGDRLTYVVIDGRELAVGADIDPLRLPDLLAEQAGKQVLLRVKRDKTGADPETVDVPITPDQRPGWIERPSLSLADSPLPVPAIGIAFHVLHHVVAVEPGSPADGKIQPNDKILSLQLLDGANDDQKPFEFGEEKRNWASVFWAMQGDPNQEVRLTIRSQGAQETKVVTLKPAAVDDWYLPIRGLAMQPLIRIRKAENIQEAVKLGFSHTRDNVFEMYLTIRSLVSGRVSPKALGGPIRIFQVAHVFSERGIPDLILFLGILSVSLAVLNFMPIPVLDGGHFVFLLYEAIRGKPASAYVMEMANRVGLVMVLCLMLWVMFLDVSGLIFGR